MPPKKLKYLRYNFVKIEGTLLKKIILFLLTFTALAMADSKIYMGTGVGYGDVVTKISASAEEEKFSEETLRFKIGYGDREAYAVEFSMDYMNSDPKKYAFDISLLKAFDLGIYINPFAKIGFGAGVLDNRDNANKSLTYGSFNLGGGILIPINEHFDAELAYEYKNRSYQRIDESDGTESRTSHVNFLYLGLNFRY
jgi:opacity protein-like surface antigen